MRLVLKRGNDQIVTLVGLQATDTKAYLNAAVVRATLYNSKGIPVLPFENVEMLHVANSEGSYEWVIEGTEMMLPKNVEYSLEITAEQTGLNYRVVHPVSVVDA